MVATLPRVSANLQQIFKVGFADGSIDAGVYCAQKFLQRNVFVF